MKRYLSLFLCIMLLLPFSLNAAVVYAAGTPSIICEDVTCEAGEQITVNVTISQNPGFAYLELTPTYSPELTLVEVENGELISDFTKGKQYVWVADEDVTADGLLMAFTFDIAQTVLPGEYTVGFVVRTCANYNEELVQFAVESGTVTVGQAAPTELDQFTYSLSGVEMTITGYIGEEEKVVIGSTYVIGETEYTVTAIADEAFLENTVIESIVIPGTVQTIGEYAFDYCENLTTVDLGDGLQTIGMGAFEGCAFTEIVLPKSVLYIGADAFYDCVNMVSATVLGKDTEIDEYAFGYDFGTKRNPYVLREGFELEGHGDSTAQNYANTEGITFKQLTRISGASLSLQHNLAINYKVNKVLFEEYGFSTPYIIVQMNDTQITLSNYVIDGDKYVFTFRNIAPNQMNDTIYATLYATCDGVEYASATREYSVAEYCYSMLELYAADEYAKLRTLLVDLLHYGAASQTYTGYRTDAMVNASLTDAQILWGTSEEPALDTVLDTTYKTVESPAAVWKGAGLSLLDSVAMRLKFIADNAEDLTVKIESGENTWTISSDKFLEEDSVYYVYFTGLNASQMRQSVFLTIYDGDTPVSNTVCYSIGSYAYEKQSSTIAGLPELVKTMMKYGDSAYAYVN